MKHHDIDLFVALTAIFVALIGMLIYFHENIHLDLSTICLIIIAAVQIVIVFPILKIYLVVSKKEE